MSGKATTAARRPSEPLKKRVAIYARKSTSAGLEQEFNSLDHQREACRFYCKARQGEGWALLDDTYEDGGYTGANTDRPAFQQLMKAVEAGHVDVVIVYKLDRFSRSIRDFHETLDFLTRHGVQLISVKEHISTEGALGRLMLTLLMAFAEFERETTAERTADKVAAAKRRGQYTGGWVPFGYKLVDKRLRAREEEAVIVREAFRLAERLQSPSAVARALNEAGYRKRVIHQKDGVVKGGKPWDKGALHRMLRNPVYAGWVVHNGERFEGEHTGLVDRDAFEAVQTILARPEKSSQARTRRPEYWLRSLVFCAKCGSAMTPQGTRKGKDTEYRYYKCAGRMRHGKGFCAAKQVKAEALEDFVLERLAQEATAAAARARGSLDDKMARRVEALRARVAEDRDKVGRSVRTLEADMEALLAELSRAGDDEAPRLHSKIQLQHVALEAAKATQESVESRWRAIEAHRDRASLPSSARLVELWPRVTGENRRRLAFAFIEKVRVDVTKNFVELHLQPDDLDGAADGEG